uniref:Geminin coiled-coil domain containing n=1 Tax=Sander lucioperca TaxID=283035 RepID=A0A8C9ZWB4_SANLU
SESECDFTSSPPAGQMWTEQLSPHLQRNKQLQDTLLQREEQLARLQDENNKLREFLTSSFVRNLEQKAKVRSLSSLHFHKKLTADGRRKLKRNLIKRVCRNLTAEFCSESSETSSSSEPNLDLWVLRTLGLKDRDTIDTSNNSSSSSSGYSLGSLEIPAKHPTYWSPPGESVPFSPISSSSPVIHQQWTPVSDCSPTSPSAEVRKPPATPQMPRSRTDLAFSMSLSPSSSVKTHSFPQGQAFVRKDTGGRWNFTWVPRQGP